MRGRPRRARSVSRGQQQYYNRDEGRKTGTEARGHKTEERGAQGGTVRPFTASKPSQTRVSRKHLSSMIVLY